MSLPPKRCLWEQRVSLNRRYYQRDYSQTARQETTCFYATLESLSWERGEVSGYLRCSPHLKQNYLLVSPLSSATEEHSERSSRTKLNIAGAVLATKVFHELFQRRIFRKALQKVPELGPWNTIGSVPASTESKSFLKSVYRVCFSICLLEKVEFSVS